MKKIMKEKNLTWKYGYPVIVIVSIVTVGISLWVCKKKKFW